MRTRIALAAVASAAALAATGYASQGSPAASVARNTPRVWFREGVAATGAVPCASCHAFRAAGSRTVVGPDLDALAPDDNAAAIVGMITRPNAEIAPGYSRNVMPRNYARTLTARQIRVLALWIDRHSAHSGE